MVHYIAVNELLKDDQLGTYRAYGLAVYEGNDQTSVLHDVFPNEREANKYADLFKREQLDTVHLEQVIEGYLQFGEI